MTHITGESPSEEEISRLLSAVDKDSSGTVSLEEFLEAVGEWLSESGSGTKRFKTLSAEEEKKELHHQIKGFFNQFKKAENYEAVRQKISDASDLADGMDTGNGWFGFRSDGQTLQQKVEFLQHFHEEVGTLETIVTNITANSIDRVNALSAMEKLLSITEVFSRPAERSAVADDLAQLFEALVRCNLPQHLVDILQTCGDDAVSQACAIRCLTLFVRGPKVPSTPVTSLMHPKQIFFKRMAISCDAPQIVARFLSFSTPEAACANAIEFVSSMVANDVEVRDYFLENYILSLLVPLVQQSTPIDILRLLSEALAGLCGATHLSSPNCLPAWDFIQPAFAPLGQMLFSDDDEVLINVLSALSIILPGMRADYSLINRILELIGTHPTPMVVKLALNVIAHVAKFDSLQTNAFLARGLLETLKVGLTSDHSIIRSASIDVLNILAGVRMQYNALVKSGVLEIIATLLPQDDSLRVKLVDFILSISQSSSLAEAMANLDFIPLLCSALTWFKEYDSVISEAYAIEGPMFNYELISDVVSAIENIVMVGEADRMEQSLSLNLFLLRFNLDCIASIQLALNGLSEIVAAGAENFRRNRDSQAHGQLEQRLFDLLRRISAAAKESNSFQLSSLAKEALLDSIKKLFDGFGVDPENTGGSTEMETSDSKNGSNDAKFSNSGRKILVKCYLPDDIRVFEVTSDISYEDLIALITAKYGRNMSASYLDPEGDPVRLDSESCATAFASVASLSTGFNIPTIKLQLSEKTAPKPNVEAPESPASEDEDANPSSRAPSKKRSRTGANVLLPNQSNKVPTAFSGNKKFAQADKLDFLEGANSLKDEFASMRLVQKKHTFGDLKNMLKVNSNDFEAAFQYLMDGNSLSLEQFTEVMNLFGVTDQLVITTNFNAHDIDRDGTIDFREFAVLLATVAQVSDEDKLKLMFRAYDADHSGNLSLDEVYNIFRAASQMNQIGSSSDAQLLVLVTKVFNEIDLDGNGEISFDEFVQGVNSGKLPILIPSQS